jgi:hypothetical protein
MYGANQFPVLYCLSKVDRHQIVAGDSTFDLDIQTVVIAEDDLHQMQMPPPHNRHLRFAVFEHQRVVGSHRYSLRSVDIEPNHPVHSRADLLAMGLGISAVNIALRIPLGLGAAGALARDVLAAG